MKNIYALVVFSITIYLFAFAMPGSSQDADNSSTINLMITPDLPASPTEEQVTAARDDFVNIYNTLSSRKLAGTIYLASDVTSSPIALFLAQLGLYTNLEFAMSGSDSEEKLSAMPYSEQLKALKKAKTQTEACRVCGKNEITVNGFRPQFYDQNEDTYKALDELGIAYDAGFAAGVLFAPGHEEDVWPYEIENHNFIAVPVSTVDVDGKKITLDDRLAKESGISSSQWYDLLVDKVDKAPMNNEPVVISLSTSVSGSGEFLEALQDFLDYAVSKDATFVTTMDLINITMGENYVPPASSECKTCKSLEDVTIIPQNNTTVESTFEFVPTPQDS